MSDLTIDSHQHVWDPRRARYDWLGPALDPINRPIGFDELRPELQACGITATVLVQSADNADDTELMLDVAAANPEVAGVVAWVPLDNPDAAAAQLAELCQHPIVVGIRNLIHNQPDPDWLLRPEVSDGLRVLEEMGVPFDLVAVLPRHLELVPILSERHPGLRIVIDHLAKPPIGLADRQPWWDLIEVASRNPNVFAKISGLYSATEAMDAWTTESIRPFFDRALDVFGSERLMYGGDWPISVLAGGYTRVWEGLKPLFAELDHREREAVLFATAASFYQLDPALLAVATQSAE